MTTYFNKQCIFANKKTLGSIVVLLMLTTASSIFAANSSLRKKMHNGFYLSLGGNYARNVNSGAASTVVTQLSNNQILTTYKNSSDIQGGGVFFGAGYYWKLASHWGMSVGGRFKYNEMTVNGNSSSQVIQNNYKYDVDAALLNAVTRLFYLHNRWQYYAELNFGIDLLNSSNYHLTREDVAEYFADTQKTHFNYGGALGVDYTLTATTSLDVSVDYMYLGKAELGGSVIASQNRTGHLTQKLQTVGASIALTHWF